MLRIAKQGSALLSGFLSLPGESEQSLASSEFSGTWLVKDSNGEPFEITLSHAGTAEANRDGEGMSGSWTETEDRMSAVISWDTGWTTKITRTGEAYIKTAYDTAAATPTNTSEAEKVSD